jgi:DNA primase
VGFISEETIQRVTESSDIVEIISSYFPLKRAGTSFRAVCPFHREKTPSFHVTPARQSFHCFGCGAGGGVLRFVMDYEHVDFPTAVRRLAQRAGIPIVEIEATAEDSQKHNQRQRLLAIHVEASAWFHKNLLKSPTAGHARDYLKSRGISAEIAKSWQLGYAPDSWDALLDHLRGARFSDSEIALSGLASSKDDEPGGRIYSRFRDRVMFPIRNDYGEVIAFSGRILNPEAKGGKYVNSPETPLFSKGRVLYGLDKTKRDLIDKNTAIVCEGQLDLISAYEAGIRHVIAPQGTAFTPDQARLLRRFVETVLLCFDSDSAGRKATSSSLPSLLSQGLTVKVVVLPPGEDPDSLIRQRGPAAFLEVVNSATDYFDHSVEEALRSGELEDAAGKSKLIRRIAPPLALVQDPVQREATLGRIASRLSLPQSAIRAGMKAPTMNSDESSSKSESPAPPEKIVLSAGMQMLCQMAVASADVREWLRNAGSAADFESGGNLIDKIAQSDFAGETLAASFLATLSAAEERTLSSFDNRRAIPDPLGRAKLTWQGLLVQQYQQTMEGLKSRLADSSISVADREKFQKQILDLKIRVADVQRPFDQA